ncbi:sugar porter family MFS transporter [Flavobacterium sp. Sd200]|uniref:sugar porter family MFS transporter n=1 Tax=Flavobacterium sp. Sd200 TaxID=2692211 RepID=UPI00136AA1E1|nr:sugar porter family MFS transporter [Flavobacterium sp. Sd200]MXN91667.1 sugar porter family MFS transporter [Flavobacterium sp. Sd200]
MQKIFFYSIVASLAGFLFGFDTVVISGADKALQTLWHSSDFFHGSVVMAMALWGTVLGAIFGGIPVNSLGRKKTLIIIGVLFGISAIGSSLANDPYIFAFFRFLGGLGIGASTIAAPSYISEIAPAKDRGRYVAFYQFNIVLGILLAFLSNYLLSDIGENAWRWMLGVQVVPSLLYLVLVTRIPESPRWLVSKGREQEAKTIFTTLHSGENIEVLISDLQQDDKNASATESIFHKQYRFPLMLAFLIAIFNQLSGINAFLYYAPRIFEEAGLGAETSLLSSMGIGAVNLVFTLIGVVLIDKLGRKKLMFIGSIGYIVSLSLVAMAFTYQWSGLAVPAFLFIFIAAHAIGQGAVIWVFIAEIFPNHLRASGQAFGSSVHWVLAAVIPSLVPSLITTIGAGNLFIFFAVMMVFQLLFVIFMMPETKGISLENINESLRKK